MPVGPYPDFPTCIAAQKRKDPSLSDESARAICGKMETDAASAVREHKTGDLAPGRPLLINQQPLPTNDISGVEFFDVGTWNGDKYTTEQLDELCANTNELIAAGLLAPPVKLGHSADQTFLEREGFPAAGWVTSVYRVGTKVLGDLATVPSKVALLVRSGNYRKVSSEIWRDFGEAPNGKKYGHVLKAIAFLGEEIPAVANLDDIVALHRDHARAVVAYGRSRKADRVLLYTASTGEDADTDAIVETLADELDRMAGRLKDATKGKIGAPRLRAFLTEVSRGARALLGGDAKKNEDRKEADSFAYTHNDGTKGGEPPWSEVDKTELPRIAFADEGKAETKSTWRYPHHQVSGGDMHLHLGGLRAALAAAGSGEEAGSSVISHLNAHAQAVGVGEHTRDSKEGADMEAKQVAKALGLKEDAGEQDILAAATANTEKASKFADAEKEVLTFREKAADDAAKANVEKAITDKKVAPAQKEWAVSYAKKDPEGFKTYVEKTPAIFASKPKGSEEGTPEGESDARSTLNRLAIAKQNESKGEMTYRQALAAVAAENPSLAKEAAAAVN